MLLCRIFKFILGCVDIFYILSVDKNRHFMTPFPPHLVHVVIELPLTLIDFYGIKHCPHLAFLKLAKCGPVNVHALDTNAYIQILYTTSKKITHR